MSTMTGVRDLSRIFIGCAVGAAFVPAYAQDGGGMAPLNTAPESSMSFGLGVATGDQKDRARFGMFNGLRRHDANGLFGFGYYKRDEASGTWVGIEGRNLTLDNRELGFSYRRLGELKFNVDYSEITRHDPRTINTSLSGAGTTTPVVSPVLVAPGAGQDLNLELKRKGLGFDLQKSFGIYQLEVSFKNEDKSGARLFGRGFACSANYVLAGVCTNAASTAVLMLPEPVDSTIRQVDARLNYNGEKLKLSGGYYGNFYINNVGSLRPTVTGGLGNFNGGAQAADAALNAYLSTPMALWPDSQSHQFFLGGNYKLDAKTKVNFKYSYTHATQKESFGSMGLTGAPGGRDNLGGILNTTKMQAGFSDHSIDKLHVHGDVVYVSKHNQTPIDTYNVQVAAGPVFNKWTNGAPSTKKFDAKLEANYRLPYNMLMVGGVKYETEDAGTFTPTDVAGGILAIRQKLENVGYRAELRKTMSEEFTGAISYVGERRKGTSPWLKVNALPLTGVFPASANCASVGANACVFSRTGAFPFVFEDLNRQKARASANWTPIERLSLQAFVDVGRDVFNGPTTSGLRDTTMYNYSLDASYEFSDNWKASAYWNTGRRTLLMGHAADYDGRVKDRATSYGLGVSGKPFAKFRIGGDLTAVLDTLRYEITPDELISAANRALLNTTGGLPDVKYKLLRINLFGEYTLDKSATLRMDWIHNRTFFNEWTYNFNGTPFLFSDNTTISAKQLQSVNFFGASYIYKFQ